MGFFWGPFGLLMYGQNVGYTIKVYELMWIKKMIRIGLD